MKTPNFPTSHHKTNRGAKGASSGLDRINQLESPFSLEPLPYAADSLEPALDTETVEIHHGKHHQAYVDKLNEAIDGEPGLLLVDLIRSVSRRPEAVHHNAGGHWNHLFFWSVLSGKPEDNAMPERLQKEIEKSFGNMEAFKEKFAEEGKDCFGSGWVWLVRNLRGQLEIVSTPNQDNPLMDISPSKGVPLLAADVWEHAYYLKYRNQRDEWLKEFWKIVNWKVVNEYDVQANERGVRSLFTPQY